MFQPMRHIGIARQLRRRQHAQLAGFTTASVQTCLRILAHRALMVIQTQCNVASIAADIQIFGQRGGDQRIGRQVRLHEASMALRVQQRELGCLVRINAVDPR